MECFGSNPICVVIPTIFRVPLVADDFVPENVASGCSDVAGRKGVSERS